MKPAPPRVMRRELGIVALLVTATVVAFSPVLQAGFINLDDDVYVTANPAVRGGLTVAGLGWALTTMHGGLWHPLTWLSHQLDVSWFGADPAGHHLTSLALHTLNVVLVFLVLRRLTGAVWQSAVAAGLFALHPLRVESVAWVAERKDVLSMLFALTSLWAYASYAARPRVSAYVLVLLCFAFGLAAKPMLVTLPFVMLLLDWWPLRRGPLGRVVLEKLPLLLLAAVTSVAAAVAAGGQLERLPLGIRVGNALVSYVRYLGKIAWPVDLAVFYPYPALAPWQVIGAASVIVAVTGVSWLRRCRQPWLLVGWLWFLGTLVPVIGLVQAGSQAMADRYAYAPAIGVFLAVAWGGADLAARASIRSSVVATGVALLLVVLGAGSWMQSQRWRSSESLFAHAVAVTPDNWLAHNNLGDALARGGQRAEAAQHFREAVRIEPRYADAHYNLAVMLMAEERLDDAAGHLEAAVRLRPGRPEAHTNLGLVRLRQGDVDVAVTELTRALTLRPDAVAHFNLGLAFARRGERDAANQHFGEALRLRPDFAEAKRQLELVQAPARPDQGAARPLERTGS